MAGTNRNIGGFPAYPLWITLPYTAFVAVLVPVYWHEHGPGNFLWFSDIALLALLITLWTGNRLVYSMMAVGVLPLEAAWLADFIAGGSLIGLAGYMFDPQEPVHLRLLSSFHFFLAPLMVWMLVRQGYDRRALPAQTVFAWVVLAASWVLTSPENNINWVHGVGPEEERMMPLPPFVYLVLYMALLPVVAFVPLHLLLRFLFRP